MTDQVVRKPQVLYRLMRSDRHAPRRSFHITPLEEEAMAQYARVKSRIAHIAQYRRARLQSTAMDHPKVGKGTGRKVSFCETGCALSVPAW
jgi:hypothetical protein